MNSYVCRIRQSIPNWNTLFKKGCASAAAQMLLHSTGIASQYYPRTIYSKLEYFVQKRLCICSSADVAAFHRHHQLVPSYHTPPGVQFLYVGRTLCYFCPLRSSQLDKSKTLYYPPTTTAPQRIFIMSDEEVEEQVSEKVKAEKNESMKITMCEKQYFFKLNNNNVYVFYSTNS